MGGSSNKIIPTQGIQAASYGAATTPQMMQFYAMPAEQQRLLAAQLQEGFGGPLSDYTTQVGAMTQDQTIPYITKPSDVAGLLASQQPAKKKKTATKPTENATINTLLGPSQSWSASERSIMGSGGNGGLFS